MKNRKESGSKETLTLSSELHTSTVRITSKHVKYDFPSVASGEPDKRQEKGNDNPCQSNSDDRK